MKTLCLGIQDHRYGNILGEGNLQPPLTPNENRLSLPLSELTNAKYLNTGGRMFF